MNFETTICHDLYRIRLQVAMHHRRAVVAPQRPAHFGCEGRSDLTSHIKNCPEGQFDTQRMNIPQGDSAVLLTNKRDAAVEVHHPIHTRDVGVVESHHDITRLLHFCPVHRVCSPPFVNHRRSQDLSGVITQSNALKPSSDRPFSSLLDEAVLLGQSLLP